MPLFLILLYNTFFPFLDYSSTYPVTISDFTEYEAGKLLVTDSSSDYISYYIKPNWGNNDEGIYTWRGIEKQHASGVSLADSYVIDAITFDNKLLILTYENMEVQCIVYDNNLKRKGNITLPLNIDDITQINGKILGRLSNDIIALHIDRYLIYINDLNGFLDFIVIDDNVDYAQIIPGELEVNNVLTIKREKQIGLISLYNEIGKFVHSSRVQLSKDYYITTSNKYYALITNAATGHAFIQILDKLTGKFILVKWIDANNQDIILTDKNELVFQKKVREKQFLSFNKVNINGLEQIYEKELPSALYSPIAIKKNNGAIIVIFKQGIAIFSQDADFYTSYTFNNEISFSDNMSFRNLEEYYIISSDYYSCTLKKKTNKYWWINKFLNELWMYFIPLILLLITIITLRKYNNSKRFLHQLLNFNSSGIIFIINAKGRLKDTNNAGQKLIGATSLTMRKKHFSYYLKKDLTMPIYRILVRVIANRTSITEKILVSFPHGDEEWLCTVSVLRSVAGAYRGLVFSGFDITEQLEKKRLNNWAQLAHDMQTNLSTIRLNTENIEEGSDIVMRSKNAILHQTNLLIHRVRDIVTVGRQEDIELEKQSSEDICLEARSEFDEAMFPNITFELETNNFQVYCDKARMIRAVRNAIENGIKAIKDKEGSITISCYRKGEIAIFSIKDTGKGMDDQTKNKMLKPYFTTAKHAGGYGIGTMIIQKVVELHNGEMSVDSELGQGTEILLKIPNYKRKISN